VKERISGKTDFASGEFCDQPMAQVDPALPVANVCFLVSEIGRVPSVSV
jgi:hypothetical protein